VALDHVVSDLGAVTSSEFGGDSELLLYCRDVMNLDEVYFKTVVS
jgi:hypothetical protein